jgi:hypothetical protein
MPFFMRIEKERRLVMSTAYGVFNLADALEHQRQLESDPDFDPSFSQLADFRQITKLELAADEVRLLAQKTIFSLQSRRAFVVKGDLAFGLARLFEILRETMGEQGIGVFRNLDDALEWVLARQTSAPTGDKP